MVARSFKIDSSKVYNRLQSLIAMLSVYLCVCLPRALSIFRVPGSECLDRVSPLALRLPVIFVPKYGFTRAFGDSRASLQFVHQIPPGPKKIQGVLPFAELWVGVP